MNRAAPVRKRFHTRTRIAASQSRIGMRHFTHVVSKLVFEHVEAVPNVTLGCGRAKAGESPMDHRLKASATLRTPTGTLEMWKV